MRATCECGEPIFVDADDLFSIDEIASAARRGKLDDALYILERDVPGLSDFCERVRKDLKAEKIVNALDKIAVAISGDYDAGEVITAFDEVRALVIRRDAA